MGVTIRPARLDDRDQIAVWTRDTFEWGDYVADALPSWLGDDRGLAMVAVDERDRPIGIGRVLLLSPAEAWLHGARVHPEHRGTGIGSALNDHGCRWAAERGAIVARLLIEDWNMPARGQVEKAGYRAVAPWTWATRSSGTADLDPRTNGGRRAQGEERLAPGTSAETEPAWIAWATSDLAATGRQLWPMDWHFRRLRPDDVASAAKRRSLWHCPSGWIIADVTEGELVVSWVVTNDLDAPRLVPAILDRADMADVETVRVWTPTVDWMVETLTGHGFATHAATVYGKPI